MENGRLIYLPKIIHAAAIAGVRILFGGTIGVFLTSLLNLVVCTHG